MAQGTPDAISERKDQHLSLCLNEDVELYSPGSNGLDAYRFEHDALPELDYARVSLETSFLGKPLSAPLIIGAMTGGTARAGEINHRLALAAERCQVGFALGSQRRMLGSAQAADGDESARASYQVRQLAPGIPLLFGNLGAVQLNYGVGTAEIRELIAATGCDAFNFHLNPLQECIQPEGNHDFSGLLEKLAQCAPLLGVPVFLKEVGSGISRATAKKLRGLPIQGIETAGVGGTSWSRIESMRALSPAARQTGRLFSRWGTPTAESILNCREALPGLSIVASGGIRNGIEVAKAIALGADAVALALPILKAAEQSVDSAVQAIETLKKELKTALFLTGLPSIAELKSRGPSLLLKRPDRTASEPA